MTIQEQKVLLKLLTPKQIAELYPAAIEKVPVEYEWLRKKRHPAE